MSVTERVSELETQVARLRSAIEEHREQWCSVNPSDERNVRPADWNLWKVLDVNS